jgi:hypothetical protein
VESRFARPDLFRSAVTDMATFPSNRWELAGVTCFSGYPCVSEMAEGDGCKGQARRPVLRCHKD